MPWMMSLFVLIMGGVVTRAGLTRTGLRGSVYGRLAGMMLLQYFIWGGYYVTMGTYLNRVGFSGLQIAAAFSTTSIAGILSPFFVGMVADRFFSAQKVLAVLHLLGGCVMYSVSRITDPVFFFWIYLLWGLLYMPTIALTNAISFHQMEEPGKEFPFVRVWGTLGWILGGLLVGFLGWDSTAFPMRLCAGVSILMGGLCFALPATPPKGTGSRASFSDVLGTKAWRLFRDRSFAVFAVSSMLICIPLAFYYNFANLFLNEGGMKAAAAKMTLGQMSEILFMLVMPFCFLRLGVKKMLLIGMAAWALRYGCFAFGNTENLVWMFYGGILLHGICYDFFFVTGQIHIDRTAPLEIQSSAQGLITMLTYGWGMLLGSWISGPIVDHYRLAGLHDWRAIWIAPMLMALLVFAGFALLFKAPTQEHA